MAVPVVVQTPNVVVVSAASSAQVTLGSAAAAGNSLVGGVLSGNSATRNWTVTDTVNAGSWTSALLYQPTQSMQIHVRHTISAGTPTITWTINTSTWNGYVWAAEVSGLDSTASPVTGTNDESPSTGSAHNCASSAVVATDAFVIGIGLLTAVATTTTAGSGYALAPALSSNTYMIEYKATASQNDTGPWGSTGTARIGRSCMAAFPAPVSAGAKPWMRPFRIGGGYPRRINHRAAA